MRGPCKGSVRRAHADVNKSMSFLLFSTSDCVKRASPYSRLESFGSVASAIQVAVSPYRRRSRASVLFAPNAARFLRQSLLADA
jgi:hypothetical protein